MEDSFHDIATVPSPRAVQWVNGDELYYFIVGCNERKGFRVGGLQNEF
jgi:hypothetical protein